METIRKLFTKLMDGKLVTVLRTIHTDYVSAWSPHDGDFIRRERYFYPREDMVLFERPVHHPRRMWDGTPYISYSHQSDWDGWMAGIPTYAEYCEYTAKMNKWVFTDFTNTEGIWLAIENGWRGH